MARDTSFYYAFLILPPAQRQAIVAVWDFCRAVDDAVDEAAPGGGVLSSTSRIRATADLESWRREIARCFGSEAPRTPQGRALQPFVHQFGLTRQPFDDLVDGVATDLARERYRTFVELSEYCMRVASGVGLICIEVFGCRTPSAREYAINLGLALQLTNIVRDVGVDLQRNRIYLPQEDLLRFGVTADDLAAGRVSDRVQALLAFQTARARDYFARAARALSPTETKPLAAAEIMGAIYRELLSRIERHRYDVFSEIIRVPRPLRAWIAFKTWARVHYLPARGEAKTTTVTKEDQQDDVFSS